MVWTSLAARLRQSALASLSNAGGLLRDARYNTLLNLNFFGNLTLYTKANGRVVEMPCGQRRRGDTIFGGPTGKQSGRLR
jgi:hypothetical protein